MPEFDLQSAVSSYRDSGQQAVAQNTANTIAPYISVVGAPVHANAQYQTQTPTASTSGLGAFTHWIGSLATETGHLGYDAGRFVYNTTKSWVTAVPRDIIGIDHGLRDNFQIDANEKQTQQLSAKVANAFQLYHTGKITKDQYQSLLKDTNSQFSDLTKNQINLNKKIGLDKTNAYNAAVDTASLDVMIATFAFTPALGGLGLLPSDATDLGVASAAAKYLASDEGKAALEPVANFINKVAGDEKAFSQLSESTQRILQRTTAEAVSALTPAENATAAQIGRATVANLAIKYPIQYSFYSSTAHQLYTELSKDKYGDALNTIALTSLLAIGGGAFGKIMEAGGSTYKGLIARTFTKDPWMDIIGEGSADNSSDAAYKAFQNDVVGGNAEGYHFFNENGKPIDVPPEGAPARVAKNLNALKEINKTLTGRTDEASAYRLLQGWGAYEGISPRDMTASEMLKNMSNYVEAFRMANKFGGEKTVLGRVTAEDKNYIMKALAPKVGTNKQATYDMLDALMRDSTSRAWPQNDNFVNQIKSLIERSSSAADFRASMKNIEAGMPSKEFPKAVSKTLAKMGYIPLTPKVVTAPFKEGLKDTLESNFAKEGDQFFDRVVQPVPVLQSLGKVLTMTGLSPVNAEEKAYNLFNSALAERFSQIPELGKIKGIKGASDEQLSDGVMKRVSAYIYKVNSGQAVSGGIRLGTARIRAPIQGVAQITTKDLMAALGVEKDVAKSVGQAIRHAYLDVPLAVRGLGDKTVDVMNNSRLFRAYLRIQGGARFSYNPIYAVKVVTKTELAAQGLAGGKAPIYLSNILGFGRDTEVTAQTLRDAGYFSKAKAGFGSYAAGGEGDVVSGFNTSLTTPLLKVQEQSIAGLINKMADRAGLDPKEFITQFPQQVHDAIITVAHYDERSEFLHSPLLRTLNFAVFPMRFEVKVAQIMAKSLAQQDVVTQMAVIAGLYNVHNWMNSAEGAAWYSQNATVLKFLNYFTPTETLSNAAQFLTALSHEDWRTAVGTYELGGLPLGFIHQILAGEGIGVNSGYVDPGTGQEIPNKIPITARAQLQVAIGDFIGSLFTYPGSDAGLPSKSKIDAFIGGAFVGGQQPKTSFNEVNAPLSKQSALYAQRVGGAQPSTPQAQATNPVQAGQQLGPNATVTPTGTATPSPYYKKTNSSTPPAKKLKKGEFKVTKAPV